MESSPRVRQISTVRCGVGLIAVQLIGCAHNSGSPHSKLVDLTLPAGSTPSPPRGEGRDRWIRKAGTFPSVCPSRRDDVPDPSPADITWLAVNAAEHQLFVSPGSGNSVYQYSY
jgi:hypothetical protein